MPGVVPGVKFNADGLCNRCVEYDKGEVGGSGASLRRKKREQIEALIEEKRRTKQGE
jgi:hypothetical protein